jgi:hypothetical protein
MPDLIVALASFLGLCIAWVAIGRRRSVRIVRFENSRERAA